MGAYDASGFDPRRLRNYARHVAEVAVDVPFSTRRTSGSSSARRRWWRPRPAGGLAADAAEVLGGWLLVVDREEGAIESLASDVRPPCIYGWEVGRFLILDGDGQLVHGRYESQTKDDFRQPIAFANVTSMQRCSDADIVSFDRYNHASYRSVRAAKRPGADRVVWREELGTRFLHAVPRAGMATSLALKRLKERHERIGELPLPGR